MKDKNNILGIFYISIVIIFVLIIRYFMSKSKTGSTLLKIGDTIALIRFMGFIVILIALLIFAYFNKDKLKKSDKSKDDSKDEYKDN